MKIKTSSLLLLFLVGCSKVTLYDYETREQITADSLRVLDSIRVADSTRTHDSLVFTRYEDGLKKLETKEKKEAEWRASLRQIEEKPDSADTLEEESGPTEIVIEEDSKNAEKIDSLQAEIDSLQNKMYGDDQHFCKMKDYELADKKAYCKFLLKHHKKDTSEVLHFCECLHKCLKMERKKLRLIMETVEGDERGVVFLHAKKAKIQMGEIGTFIYALTSNKEPAQIEYSTKKKSVWERDK